MAEDATQVSINVESSEGMGLRTKAATGGVWSKGCWARVFFSFVKYRNCIVICVENGKIPERGHGHLS